MKIRIKGNSIRIRLTQSEVATFSDTDYLEEVTEFGGGNVLITALQTKPGDIGLSAEFYNNKVTMFVSPAQKEEWISTNVVGFNNCVDIDNGKQLFLLLEKDWVCIDNTMDEDQSDNFPNPNLKC